MSTQMTSAAPLINLAIYCLTMISLAGMVVWLSRWLERTAGTTYTRTAVGDSGSALLPTWERAVPTTRHPARPTRRVIVEDWTRRSLFALLVRHERLAICGVFGISLLLRLPYLGSFPDNVTVDELDFAGNVISIFQGKGPAFFGLDWTPEPAFSVYLINWSWHLFGMTLFAERFVSALLTAIAIFPFYALLRRVVTVPAALAASILLSSSWWLLNFSRSGWNNGHVVLYLLLAAWSLTRALERQRWRDWIGFGAALALLLYGYFSGRMVFLALLAYLPLVLWWRWRGTLPNGWRRPLAGALLAGVVCTLLFLPMAVVALNDLPRFTSRTSDVFILHQPREAGMSTADVLRNQAWLTVRSFVLMDTSMGDGRYKGPGMAWLDPISALLYLAGLILAVRRGRETVLWWLLLFIPLGTTQILSAGTPDGARGLVAVAPMYFFAALAIDEAIARRWLRGQIGQLVVAAVLVLAAVINVRSYVGWMDSTDARTVRRPSIPAAEFPRWRDFQTHRLQSGENLVLADTYMSLPADVIDKTIAGENPPIDFNAPALNVPSLTAQLTTTFGTAGDSTGQLTAPYSVAVDGQGIFYVADPKRAKIVRFAPDGTFVDEWGDKQQLGTPASVIVAPDGSIVVLNADLGIVTRHEPNGTLIGKVAALGGPARGMALGRDGRIYVAFTFNSRVVVLPGKNSDPEPEGDPVGWVSPYSQPTSAIADSAGNVYVYEPTMSRIQSQTPEGQPRFTVLAPANGTFEAGGLAMLPDGTLLLADTNEERIAVYRADGTLLGAFPVEGKPRGVSVTASGLIAVTDTEGQCIRLYTLSLP